MDEARFWARVEEYSKCWIWRGSKNDRGYGKVWFRGGCRRAHRIAYELVFGAIPDGLELDHLCKRRDCVNPFHLEQVTHSENVRRSDAGKRQREKEYCIRGHGFSPDNTYHRSDSHRACKQCMRILTKEYRQRKLLTCV